MLPGGTTFDETVSYSYSYSFSPSVFGKVQAEHADECADEDDFQRNRFKILNPNQGDHHAT